ncbi:PTS mannitol transporter subunit IICB [Paludifilum halophilum]|uniref:PTS system mannitol-specific EIICB component n=1 Tax=Paludifilum halophilum TaxID=1642702 RepID=A0A235BCH9_9BACL|nr:PTS mannitol transporter subunit IICB [Paludifilum halophilum]OYD09996.1 PTS mannitol transporter subunit IIBC [Paludifilum halophilum]
MGADSDDKGDIRVKIQRFGSYLSGLIMPNIGAFIAWGLITALFIPSGWFPNEDLARLVEPMIQFLLPLLIGYTGGKMVFGSRGGVVGATATIGVIVGADIPMFLGAMVMGPLGGVVIKYVDRLFEGKVRSGFEMLVNNFSVGIVGALLTLAAYKAVGPVVLALNKILAAGVEWIIATGLLPLANVFIEPAKVLFLNNAINHGILSPIGVNEAAETGKSILFLLEPNPGPGLGILLAYWAFGRKTAKQSAPGAAVIHFLGGIHEIYFPYILMRPVLILAAIAGGISGVFVFALFEAGLVAVPSPGSIFALLAMTPRGNYDGVLTGVIVSTIVSFLVSALFLRKNREGTKEDFEEASRRVQDLKGKPADTADQPLDFEEENPEVNKIVFACDAGMGSSAMGASVLKNKVEKAGLPIEVTNTSINQLPEDADIVITHKNLTDRAKAKQPKARHLSVDNFLSAPLYDELIEELKR